MKTPVLESLFNSEYCEILKSTNFEEQLRTAASENVSIKLKKLKIVHKEFQLYITATHLEGCVRDARTLAQDSRVLTPPPPLFRLCSLSSTTTPLLPQGMFVLATTHPLTPNFYDCEIQRQEINNECQYIWLNST